jgi:hypothetical protein
MSLIHVDFLRFEIYYYIKIFKLNLFRKYPKLY